MGTSFRKFKLFFHKVSFPPLRETLYAGRLQLLAEAAEFFTYVELVVVRKTASYECIFQEAKNMEVGGC